MVDPLFTLVIAESAPNLNRSLTIVEPLALSCPAISSVLKISFHLSQTRNSMTLVGIVVARNSHQSGVTVSLPFYPLKNAVPKKLDTAVAKRNIIVNAVIVFIAALSFYMAWAIDKFVSLSFWPTRLKTLPDY